MKDKEFIKTTACIGAGLVAFMIAGTVIYQVSRQKLILPVSFINECSLILPKSIADATVKTLNVEPGAKTSVNDQFLIWL